MKQTNKMIRVAMAILVLTGAFWLSACQKEKDPATPTGGATNNLSPEAMSTSSLIFPVQAHMYGKTYAQWGAELFKWQFAFDCDHSPYLDTDGSFQNQNQSGDVFFLGGARYGIVTERSVTIPAGKSLLVPLVYYFANTGCGETVDQIMPDVTGTVPFMDQLLLEIDGNAVANIGNYHAISSIFDYVGDPCWNARFCIDGTAQKAVIGGYWVMLKPLSPGSHTIHTTGGASKLLPVIKDVTWHITQQ